VHAPADKEHQKPFKHRHRNVTGYDLAARRCDRALRMLLCGVLKETASDGQPYKNRNENNRMPKWSYEWDEWGDEKQGLRLP
jgi:hypothetical protein